MSLVSIVVPVHNVRPYLGRCVESLLSQTYQNVEVLLIDDGSTDGSGEVCSAISKDDSRVKVRKTTHRGVSSARNIGISMASGDYLMFVDADDRLEPEGIEAMLTSLAGGSADACIADSYFRGDSVRTLPDLVVNSGSIYGSIALYEHLRLRFTSGLWLFLFRRDVVGDLQFNEDIHQMEDWEYLVRAIDRMRCLSVLHSPIYHNEIRVGSASAVAVDSRVLTCLSVAAEAKLYLTGRERLPQAWDTYVRVRMLMKLLGMAARRGVANRADEDLLRKTARADFRVVLTSKKFAIREKAVIALAAGSPRLAYGWYRFRDRTI